MSYSTRQDSLHNKEASGPKVNSAEVEKPCFKPGSDIREAIFCFIKFQPLSIIIDYVWKNSQSEFYVKKKTMLNQWLRISK